MIEINKTLIKQIKDGLEDKKVLIKYLYSQPINEVIESYADMLLSYDNTQITVSMEEYEKICSLFKIRGIRVLDGKEVKENRGRNARKILKGE